MRIKLKSGKQKELINKLKENGTWKELSKELNLSEGYLRNELRNERTLLSEKSYKKICEILGMSYDPLIEEKLEDNWGRSKGGLNSKGNTKLFKDIDESEELAELFGIILGDGHLEVYKKGEGKVLCSKNCRPYCRRL